MNHFFNGMDLLLGAFISIILWIGILSLVIHYWWIVLPIGFICFIGWAAKDPSRG